MWKHWNNPFGESPCLVYVENGKIVGLRTFLRWHWRANSRILTAVRAVDTATHPNWQGKGLFSRLTTTLLESMRSSETCFVFNTPNSSSLPGYLKMGWRIVTRVPLMIRPLRPFSMLWRSAVRSKSGRSNMEESWPSANTFQDCLDRILSDRAAGAGMHTVRSMDHFRWRYRQIPGIEYSAFADFREDQAALIVGRERSRKHWQELSISELLFTSQGMKSGIHVLQEMLSRTSADYAIAIAAKDTPEEAVLKKCGFYNIGKRGPVLTFLDLNECAPGMDLGNWSNWRCSIGDLEIF